MQTVLVLRIDSLAISVSKRLLLISYIRVLATREALHAQTDTWRAWKSEDMI